MSYKKICLLLLGAILVVQAGAVELLTNGNLNSVTGGIPDGWSVYIATPASAWFAMETATSSDGTPCARMYINQASPGIELGQTVTFDPNTIPTLNFSCIMNTQWYSSNNWGDATVEMTYSEPNGTYVSYDEYVILADNMYPAPTTWTTYSHAFTVPPTAGQVKLVLRGSDWIKGLYWDNVSLGYTGNTQAELVYPANMSSVPWEAPDNCGNGPKLHWNAAPEATGVHYVYFGTSETAVADATASDPEYKGTAPLNDPNYVLSLANVTKGQTYYWRVDETTDIGVVKGLSIGQFSISLFTDLDTFDYSSDTQLQAVWGTGAVMNDGAMQISYNNTASPYYTEAASVTQLGCSSDWTRGGNQMLALDVKGHDNMVDSMYVTLESNSGAQSGTVQYSDKRELNQQSYEWSHFWPIDLQEFADQGVQLTNVTKIIIGVGDKITPAAGGSGAVLVNSVRLSSPMCLRGYTPADINQDCVVDIYDLFEVSGYWLDEGYSVAAQTPVRGPVVWYKFDEGSGTTVVDASGCDNDGTLNIEGTWGGTGSGYDGSDCLNLNNTTYVQVPVAAANIGDPNGDPNDQVIGAESTICLWLKDPGQVDADNELFQIGADGDLAMNWMEATGKFDYFTAGGNELLWKGSRFYADNDIYTNPSHLQDQWVHYAFVKSYNAGYMRIYQNGKLVAQSFADGNYSPLLDGVDSFFSIGAWRWSGGAGGYVNGLIDDFRLYNYALSQEEVLSLAVAGGTATDPLYQPLIIPSDVVGDNKIDLKDFAEVAKKWQEEVVYP